LGVEETHCVSCCLTAIVTDAATATRAYDAIRRVAGIKKIDNRLISAHLLTFD
jgi:hypothetical protein